MVSLILAAVTVFVYEQVRHHEFVTWDDPTYVSNNPMVANGVTWNSVTWAFSSGAASNWHPLTWLSHIAGRAAVRNAPRPASCDQRRPSYRECCASLHVAESRDADARPERVRCRAVCRPSAPRRVRGLAEALAGQGKMSEAIAHYSEAVRIKPASADAHSNLANLLVSAGRVPEAIAHYTEALRISPGLPEGHNNLGNAFANIGKTDDAIAESSEALRISPNHADAHYNLAVMLSKRTEDGSPGACERGVAAPSGACASEGIDAPIDVAEPGAGRSRTMSARVPGR